MDKKAGKSSGAGDKEAPAAARVEEAATSAAGSRVDSTGAARRPGEPQAQAVANEESAQRATPPTSEIQSPIAAAQ